VPSTVTRSASAHPPKRPLVHEAQVDAGLEACPDPEVLLVGHRRILHEHLPAHPQMDDDRNGTRFEDEPQVLAATLRRHHRLTFEAPGEVE